MICRVMFNYASFINIISCKSITLWSKRRILSFIVNISLYNSKIMTTEWLNSLQHNHFSFPFHLLKTPLLRCCARKLKLRHFLESCPGDFSTLIHSDSIHSIIHTYSIFASNFIIMTRKVGLDGWMDGETDEKEII